MLSRYLGPDESKWDSRFRRYLHDDPGARGTIWIRLKLKKFDAADMTSDDYPDTADWHASEEGQEERRQVATQGTDALNMFVDPARACGLLDGVPGVKVVAPGSAVGELEGTTPDEARDAGAKREGITWWPEARYAEPARQHRGGIT